MNAIDLLLEQHDLHRALLGSPLGKEEFQKFRRELIHHVNIEEAILYPNLLKVPELETLVREAWEDHSICMRLLQEMDEPDLTVESWEAKLRKLKQLHLQHLSEEEEHLFPEIRSRASEAFLAEVGEQMLIQQHCEDTEEIIYPEEPGSHQLP